MNHFAVSLIVEGKVVRSAMSINHNELKKPLSFMSDNYNRHRSFYFVPSNVSQAFWTSANEVSEYNRTENTDT